MPTQQPATATPYTQKEVYDWTQETGEVRSVIQEGQASAVAANYALARSAAALGNDTASISYETARGRGILTVRYARSGVLTIEELYGVDVIKDVLTASYFDSLSDAEVAVVRKAYVDGPLPPDAGWSAMQLTLYQHFLHGAESFYETGFVLRVSKQGVRTSALGASYANLNEVVATPTLSSAMETLVDALPAGEWLKKPPNVLNLGKGRWKVDQEYHWADRWSVVYGGTWLAPAP